LSAARWVVQLAVGTLFSAIYLLLQELAEPYATRSDNHLASCCSFLLLVFFCCCTVSKMGTPFELEEVLLVISSEQERDFRVPWLAIEVILFASVIGSLLVAFVLLLVQLAMERAQMEREAAAKLLQCESQMAEGQEYVCFLSQCVAGFLIKSSSHEDAACRAASHRASPCWQLQG
jgi:hypothetical protein